MADQNLATDMSGRPIRRPTVEEILASDVSQLPPPGGAIAIMADGTEAFGDEDGKYYPIKDDGLPDWDHPLDEVDDR